MEPTSVSGANFLNFGRTVFSCNNTVVWPCFKGPGGHGTIQKRRQKVLWKGIAEKTTEMQGKYRKVRQKSFPGDLHWSQTVTKNRLKSMLGLPGSGLGPFLASGGLRVGARTPKYLQKHSFGYLGGHEISGCVTYFGYHVFGNLSVCSMLPRFF